ncbi:hypothetical protein GCM10010246_50180 [Streptomyces cuspidosporus]|uniref:Secreted protein n=1 Tax=Streptomyces cuspidosporus TaxID=66882 RepID=A0ABN3GLW1_9ACTN
MPSFAALAVEAVAKTVARAAASATPPSFFMCCSPLCGGPPVCRADRILMGPIGAVSGGPVSDGVATCGA